MMLKIAFLAIQTLGINRLAIVDVPLSNKHKNKQTNVASVSVDDRESSML